MEDKKHPLQGFNPQWRSLRNLPENFGSSLLVACDTAKKMKVLLNSTAVLHVHDIYEYMYLCFQELHHFVRNREEYEVGL